MHGQNGDAYIENRVANTAGDGETGMNGESSIDIYIHSVQFGSVQFSSVAQACPTLCDPMNRSTPGLPVHHQLHIIALNKYFVE